MSHITLLLFAVTAIRRVRPSVCVFVCKTGYLNGCVDFVSSVMHNITSSPFRSIVYLLTSEEHLVRCLCGYRVVTSYLSTELYISKHTQLIKYYVHTFLLFSCICCDTALQAGRSRVRSEWSQLEIFIHSIDSSCNRNEYQEYYLEVVAVGA